MKIAFVGGLQDVKLRQKLAPIAYLREVQTIDLYRRKPYRHEKIRWRGPPPIIAGWRIAAEAWRVLVLLSNAWRYDVLIACGQKYHGLWCWVAGKLWRKPVVQLIIAQVDWCIDNPLFRQAVMSAAACGVRGTFAMQQLRTAGYTEAAEIIPNPYAPPEVDEIESRTRRYDLLCVAYLAPSKGLPWVLEVVARLKRSRPAVTIALCGVDPLEDVLGAQIDSMGLRDNVTFLGWLPEKEMSEAYRMSRALILGSTREGLPMCVVEAMSYALPVFVTPVGENPWLVRDKLDGRIIPHGETEAMADAVAEILEHPELQKRMGDSGRQHISALAEEWTVQAIAETWRKLITDPQYRSKSTTVHKTHGETP